MQTIQRAGLFASCFFLGALTGCIESLTVNDGPLAHQNVPTVRARLTANQEVSLTWSKPHFEFKTIEIEYQELDRGQWLGWEFLEELSGRVNSYMDGPVFGTVLDWRQHEQWQRPAGIPGTLRCR